MLHNLTKSLTAQHENTLEQDLKSIIDSRLNEIRKGYYQHFIDIEKRTSLQKEFDNINISRNLILSFIFLLGFDPQFIDEIRSLFNSASLNAHANQQIENIDQQIQLSQLSIQSPMTESQLIQNAIGNALVNTNAQAMQTLKNIITEPDLQKKLTGYRIDDIILIQNRIDALRRMEKEPYHPSLPIIETVDTLTCNSEGICGSHENNREHSSAWPLPGANAQTWTSLPFQTSAASTLVPFYLSSWHFVYDGALELKNSILNSFVPVISDLPKKIHDYPNSFRTSCQLSMIEGKPLLLCQEGCYITYVFPKVPTTSTVEVYKPQETPPSPHHRGSI